MCGPEMLVIPALTTVPWLEEIWLLKESRAQGENDVENFCRSQNLSTRVFDVQKRFDFRVLIQLRQALSECKTSSRGKPVIVHCHDVKASLYIWCALLWKRKSGLHTVTTHHGAMARPDVRSRIYEMLFVVLAPWMADMLFCVSESEYRILHERGWPREKMVLHRNGIDRPTMHWREKSASCHSHELRLVTVARLSQEKNHARLFEVLSEMKKISTRPWSLDVVGAGSQEAKLRILRSKLGLEEQVRFLGHVPEAWRILHRYHLLLIFSKGEGLPVCLLEAAWRSTPVFASAVGGIPELLSGGRGELFDLGSSNKDIAQQLHRYASDTERQQEYAKGLFQFVKNEFSQSKWLSELEKNYLKLVREG